MLIVTKTVLVSSPVRLSLQPGQIKLCLILPATRSHCPNWLADDSGGMKYLQCPRSSLKLFPQWALAEPRIVD